MKKSWNKGTHRKSAQMCQKRAQGLKHVRRVETHQSGADNRTQVNTVKGMRQVTKTKLNIQNKTGHRTKNEY